jgi:cyclopropane fatty-acyl-phospholipid synthase-like methyltransferase
MITLGYYDDEDNVEEYIKMAEGYDGREFIPVIQKYLKDGSTILELGMGPGKDLELLAEHFQVTGSDISQVFLDRYWKDHPGADLELMDAVKMDIKRNFDGIYSNKVLHHLTKEQLEKSLTNQVQVLNRGGILLHTFWYGDKEEEHLGLQFSYYTEKTFCELVGDEYDILKSVMYAEMETRDSIYFVLRKKW